MAKVIKTGLMGIFFCLISTSAFAKSISLKDAGVTLWIFIAIGAVIVLLQLIPAAILFFAFIGTTLGLSAKKKVTEKAEEKEKVTLQGFEPAPAKKLN